MISFSLLAKGSRLTILNAHLNGGEPFEVYSWHHQPTLEEVEKIEDIILTASNFILTNLRSQKITSKENFKMLSKNLENYISEFRNQMELFNQLIEAGIKTLEIEINVGNISENQALEFFKNMISGCFETVKYSALAAYNKEN